MIKEVVRIAVSNNFNCTDAEFKQVDCFSKINPDKFFFVNCNVKTPKLLNINNHNYKCVVTANPELIVNDKLINKLYAIKDKISFVRVKYLPENKDITNLIKKLSKDGFKIIITNMRFNGKVSLLKHTEMKYYEHSFSRYRLNDKYFKQLCKLTDSLKNVYICDRKHTGCSGCGLCASLNGHKNKEISSLNLSTSGLCKFNCVDCYAKTMQNFLIKCGKPAINFDTIKQNRKQKGTSKYITAHKGNK